MTYQEIADRIGITEMGAYKAVMRILDRMARLTAEDATKVRDLEIQRLDKLLNAVWAKAEKGDPTAVKRVLEIQERRAKLLGLDSANKMHVEGEIGIRQYEGVPVEEV